MKERLKWGDLVRRVHSDAPYLKSKGVDLIVWKAFFYAVNSVLDTGLSLTIPQVGTLYRRTRKAHRVTLNGVESVIPEMNEIGFRLSKGFK